jgi:hypothetical protein
MTCPACCEDGIGQPMGSCPLCEGIPDGVPSRLARLFFALKPEDRTVQRVRVLREQFYCARRVE